MQTHQLIAARYADFHRHNLLADVERHRLIRSTRRSADPTSPAPIRLRIPRVLAAAGHVLAALAARHGLT